MQTEPDEHRFIQNEFGERFLYGVNREDFASTSCLPIFQSNFDQILFAEHQLYFVIGSDSGLLAKYLYKKGVAEKSRYVFIEPEPLLPIIQSECGELGHRISFSTPAMAIRTAAIQGEAGIAHYIMYKQFKIIKSIAARRRERLLYTSVYTQLLDAIASFNTSVVSELNQKHHIVSRIRNLSDLGPSCLPIKGLFKGKTAVVMGAGPSLSEGIPWVKKFRNDLLIIAASRVSQFLQQHHIEPDLVTCIDPFELGFNASRELLTWEKAIFVYTGAVLPTLLGQWSGSHLYMGHCLPWPSSLDEKENLQVYGTTVINASLLLAYWIGAKQIVLLGVDNCQSRKGHHHAGNDKKDPAPIFPVIQWVTTYSGEKAISIPDYVSGGIILNSQAALIAKEGVSIINPSPFSMQLDHIPHVPYEKIQPEPLTKPAVETLREHLPEKDWRHYLGQVENELSLSITRIKRARKMARSAQKIILLLAQGQYKRKRNPYAILRQLKDGIMAITEAVIAQKLNWIEFAEASFALESDSDEKRNLRANRHFFLACENTAAELLFHLQEALERNRIRQEELSEQPKLNDIIRQWEKDRQPGRVLRWKKLHPAHYQKHQSQLLALETAFSELMKYGIEQGQRTKAPYRATGSLPIPVARAIRHYDNKESEGLKQLLETLADHINEPPEQSALIEGYLIELEKGPIKALPAYQCAINYIQQHIGEDEWVHYLRTNPDSRHILELVLERIAAISLESSNSEQAIDALSTLSMLTEEYTPTLAAVLFSNGLTDEAIQTLGLYLQKSPHDLASVIMLGDIYMSLGDYQQAMTMAEYVLGISPEHSLARKMLDISRINMLNNEIQR